MRPTYWDCRNQLLVCIYKSIYVSGSSKIQTLSHDSSSIETEVYSDGKSVRLLKLVFFIYKGAGIIQTSTYIIQRVLATPTLIDTCSMNIINVWILPLPFTYIYIYIFFFTTTKAVQRVTSQTYKSEGLCPSNLENGGSKALPATPVPLPLFVASWAWGG